MTKSNLDGGLIAACEEWLVQERRLNEDLEAVSARHDEADAQEAADAFASEQWDRLMEICGIPAFTIGGLNGKVKLLNAAHVFTNFMGDDPNLMARAILQDIERVSREAGIAA